MHGTVKNALLAIVVAATLVRTNAEEPLGFGADVEQVKDAASMGVPPPADAPYRKAALANKADFGKLKSKTLGIANNMAVGSDIETSDHNPVFVYLELK